MSEEYQFVGGWGANLNSESNNIDRWTSYTNHRDIISSMVTKFAPSNAESLCVLGAGVCLDLDLQKLVGEFSEISLLDLSSQMLGDGVKHQQQKRKLSASDVERIKLIGNCDLTGVHRVLQKLSEQPGPIENHQLDSVFDTMENYSPPGMETYDCVVSTCVLSQLLSHVNDTLGDDHPRFIELVKAVRKKHCEILVDSLKPNGCGFLITDFVSSESLPELYNTTDLKTCVADAVKDHNHLHGLNPAMVTQVFNSAEIRAKINSLHLTAPWRWVMPERIYACFALTFVKN